MEINASSYEFKSLFKGQLLSYLVGFYIFAFYLELHARFPILQAIRFQFTYGAIIGAFCLYKLFTDDQKQQNLNSVTKTTFFLIFILGFYTVFSMDRTESIMVYRDHVLKFALVSFFIYAATNKIEDFRVIIAFMLLAWLKMGQEGFIGWYSGSLVWENQGIPRLHGSTAMYGHPNSFSGFAVGCLPYTVFLLMCVKNNLLRLALIALIACCIIIIVTTGSRTGYVAVVAGIFYFFTKMKAGKFKILLLATVTIALTINFVPPEYKGRFESIFTGEEKQGHSSDKRKQIMRDAIAIYIKYPLGVGVQAFPKVREEMFGRFQNTHNLYLEVLTNIGPIGLIVFIVFFSKIITLNIKNIKFMDEKCSNTINIKLLRNLSKGTIGFILMRLILGLFGMDLYEIYWWLALGITLAITKLLSNKEFLNENKLIKV